MENLVLEMMDSVHTWPRTRGNALAVELVPSNGLSLHYGKSGVGGLYLGRAVPEGSPCGSLATP